MHGPVDIQAGESPVWLADHGIATSRAVLDTSEYCVEEVRRGLAVSLKTKPGFVVIRMRSDVGPIELAMTPQDGATVKALFPPCPSC